MRRSGRRRSERGDAVVDFVLVLVVLIPLFLGILQLALVLLVRNTLTAAASEGARYAATLGHGPQDGLQRTRSQITGALAGRYARDVSCRYVSVGGARVIEIRVHAVVPTLGIGGPALSLDVVGHAVEEDQP